MPLTTQGPGRGIAVTAGRRFIHDSRSVEQIVEDEAAEAHTAARLREIALRRQREWEDQQAAFIVEEAAQKDYWEEASKLRAEGPIGQVFNGPFQVKVQSLDGKKITATVRVKLFTKYPVPANWGISDYKGIICFLHRSEVERLVEDECDMGTNKEDLETQLLQGESFYGEIKAFKVTGWGSAEKSTCRILVLDEFENDQA